MADRFGPPSIPTEFDRIVAGFPQLAAGAPPGAVDVAHHWQATQIALTTAAVRLARSNPNRIDLLVENYGTGRCYVGPDAGVTTATGKPILENGGELEFLLTEDADIVFNELWGIGAAASLIVVTEVIRD